MKSYEEQRRERLNEAIFDYIQDENASARDLYLDIRNEIESTLQYHRKYVNKCNELMDHLNGFREIDLGYSEEDSINFNVIPVNQRLCLVRVAQAGIQLRIISAM